MSYNNLYKMNKSYAFVRPVDNSNVPVKRQRRKHFVVINKNVNENTFQYVCFDCSAPININAHSEAEIECSACSGRIIRKMHTSKDRVVEAI